ncbi:MAG: hypothetical protein KIT10_10465 [Flavobacteriales bacterium]|nr:hypothetical protein [Flavobacteriales bacterium]
MMRTHIPLRNIALVALTLGLAMSGCKKDDDPPAPAPPAGGGGGGSQTPGTTPNFVGADGLLAATRVITSQDGPFGPIEFTMGVASGAFSNDDWSTFVSVGAVTCNSETLTAQSNNSYVFMPGAANPSGIDLTASNNVTWTVAGGNGFPDFDRTITGPFPGAGPITSSATIVRSQGYTLTSSSVLNADSVVFTLGSLVKTLPGNAASCSFSVAELETLAAGASLVQIAPYNSTTEDIGGKTIYFVKQASRSRSVTLQ